jgi:hypothetical protein
MGKFCVNCGVEYEIGDRFCTKCGFTIPQESTQFVAKTKADLVPSSKVEFVATQDVSMVQTDASQSSYRPRSNSQSAWILGALFIGFGLILGLIFFAYSFHSPGDMFGSFGAEMGRLGGELGRMGGEFGRMSGDLGGVFGDLGGSLGSAFGSLAYNFRWVFRIFLIALFIVPGVVVLHRSRKRSGCC